MPLPGTEQMLSSGRCLSPDGSRLVSASCLALELTSRLAFQISPSWASPRVLYKKKGESRGIPSRIWVLSVVCVLCYVVLCVCGAVCCTVCRMCLCISVCTVYTTCDVWYTMYIKCACIYYVYYVVCSTCCVYCVYLVYWMCCVFYVSYVYWVLYVLCYVCCVLCVLFVIYILCVLCI